MEGFGKPPLPPPPPTPSSSRCHNANQENGNTTDDASAEIPKTQEVSRAAEVPVDPDHEKKLKRILATREYSKRYHNKQLQRIDNLETAVKVRQTEIAVTSPRVRYTRRTNMLLRAENDQIQQKIATVTGKLMVKEAEYKELRKERDLLKQRFQMQQAQAALTPVVDPGYMAFNPPAQLACQVFGKNFGPSYQPYNPPAGLDSATVGFGQFQAPVAPAQFSIEQPAGLDGQPRSDPAGLNRQSDEPVRFSEFTNELSLVVRPHIMPNKDAEQVGDGDPMNLDNPDDSKKAAGSSSFQFM
uniref:uncharacterized protein LOC105350507 n=1 Tax=Fragaria vesca subsp. vesca TaxID=101020 RepID=UPI0005CA623A|nr:PREDICTED: uncharacterized protein LOC105350507 [Fragaria vesca subsp. vesca]XP_011460970.1 PREDICTED: uncharacterized protein LOC105350507 [Fragaria vesca subsp. vesca]